MPDWTSSMQQTFEYYVVDPESWTEVRKLNKVVSSSIDWDPDSDTLGSATIDTDENLGECYVRIYLVTIQNGVTEKHPLGTFIVQTPSESFDGKSQTISVDAYTPLLELKENYPPLGFFIEKQENIMKRVSKLTRENLRAPVISEDHCDEKLTIDYIADPTDTWIVFLKELASSANYSFRLHEDGSVYFAPKQDLDSMRPVWTYTDDNSSILYPEIRKSRDLYGIPNVVEVICSTTDKNAGIRVVIENNDINSPTSIQQRGRRITHRVTDPEIIGVATEDTVREYAISLLKELSSVECVISYTHAYCPVKVGDCVRLNYERAGLENIKAKVVKQNISCKPGCPVSETATYTTKFWRGEDAIK